MGREGGERDGEGVGWHGENGRGRTGGERRVLAPEKCKSFGRHCSQTNSTRVVRDSSVNSKLRRTFVVREVTWLSIS